MADSGGDGRQGPGGLPHAGTALALYNERTWRRRSFARFDSALSGPSWDMLLLLYMAAAEGRRLSTADLCGAGDVSPPTGLRHLATLQRQGIVVRENDAAHRRRQWVRFTDEGLTAMRLHLERVEDAGMNHPQL